MVPLCMTVVAREGTWGCHSVASYEAPPNGEIGPAIYREAMVIPAGCDLQGVADTLIGPSGTPPPGPPPAAFFPVINVAPVEGATRVADLPLEATPALA